MIMKKTFDVFGIKMVIDEGWIIKIEKRAGFHGMSLLIERESSKDLTILEDSQENKSETP